MPDREKLDSGIINDIVEDINRFRNIFKTEPIILLGEDAFIRFNNTTNGLSITALEDGAEVTWRGTKIIHRAKLENDMIRISAKDSPDDPLEFGFIYSI